MNIQGGGGGWLRKKKHYFNDIVTSLPNVVHIYVSFETFAIWKRIPVFGDVLMNVKYIGMFLNDGLVKSTLITVWSGNYR